MTTKPEHVVHIRKPDGYTNIANDVAGDGVTFVWGHGADGKREVLAAHFDGEKFTDETVAEWLKAHELTALVDVPVVAEEKPPEPHPVQAVEIDITKSVADIEAGYYDTESSYLGANYAPVGTWAAERAAKEADATSADANMPAEHHMRMKHEAAAASHRKAAAEYEAAASSHEGKAREAEAAGDNVSPIIHRQNATKAREAMDAHESKAKEHDKAVKEIVEPKEDEDDDSTVTAAEITRMVFGESEKPLPVWMQMYGYVMAADDHWKSQPRADATGRWVDGGGGGGSRPPPLPQHRNRPTSEPTRDTPRPPSLQRHREFERKTESALKSKEVAKYIATGGGRNPEATRLSLASALLKSPQKGVDKDRQRAAAVMGLASQIGIATAAAKMSTSSETARKAESDEIERAAKAPEEKKSNYAPDAKSEAATEASSKAEIASKTEHHAVAEKAHREAAVAHRDAEQQQLERARRLREAAKLADSRASEHRSTARSHERTATYGKWKARGKTALALGTTAAVTLGIAALFLEEDEGDLPIQGIDPVTAEMLKPILAFNPNHGAGGRFASAPGGSQKEQRKAMSASSGTAVSAPAQTSHTKASSASNRAYAASKAADEASRTEHGAVAEKAHREAAQFHRESAQAHKESSRAYRQATAHAEEKSREHQKSARHHEMRATMHKYKRVGKIAAIGTAAAGAGALAIKLIGLAALAAEEPQGEHEPIQGIDPVTAEMLKTMKPIHAAATPSHYPEITGRACEATINAAATPEKTPRFKVSPAYNGGPLKVGGYALPIIVDLSGMTNNVQCIEANLFHEGGQLVGHVDNVTNNGRVLAVEGPLSVPGSDLDKLMTSYKRGFPWKASIQARPTAKPESIAAGKKVRVNGREFDGPVLVARKSELYGISFVPRGADDQTSVSIAAQAAHHRKERDMPTFEQWLEGLGLTDLYASATDAQKASVKAKFDDAMKAIKAAEDAEKPCDTEEEEEDEDKEEVAAQFDVNDIICAYDEQTEELTNLFAQYADEVDVKELHKIQASAGKEARLLKQTAIKAKWDTGTYADKWNIAKSGVELALVRAARVKGPDIISTPSDPPVTSDILCAAMCESMNYQLVKAFDKNGRQVDQVVEKWDDGKVFAPQTLDAAHKRYKGRIGLQQMLLHAAQANGCKVREFPRGGYKDILAYAFNSVPGSYAPIHAEGESGLSLDGILSNYMNKFLLQGFYMVEQVWRSICSVKPVNDFKTAYSYRMTSDSIFHKVGPTGEIDIGTLSDETYTNQAETYARGFNLDRRIIVNDDLAAMTQLPVNIGRGSGVALNKMFWTAFLDNSTFFQTTGNAITSLSGAGSALGINGLTAAETSFVRMKDVNGQPIGHYPSMLLVPPELNALASNIFNVAPATQFSSTELIAQGNPHAGKYTPVMSRYLSNSAFTGYSLTAWYLMANPATSGISTIEVVFLYGQESPTIESSQADFDTLGIKFRGWHDAGCTKQDHRGAVKSAGV